MKIKKWYQGLSKTPRGILAIIGFMLAIRAAQVTVIQPILNGVFGFGVSMSGYGLLFNNSILGFFLLPEGIITLIVMIILITAISALEFSILTGYLMQFRTSDKPSMIEAIKNPPLSRKHMNPISIIGYFLYTIVFLPIAGLGYASSLFTAFAIPNFITGEIAKNNFGPVLITLIYGAIGVLFFISIYTIPIMFIQETSFFRSLRGSVGFVRQHIKTFLQLVVVYLLIIGIFKWLPQLFLENQSIEVLLNELAGAQNSDSMLRTVGLIAVWSFTSFMQMILSPIALFVIIQNYLKEEKVMDESLRTNISMGPVIGLYKKVMQHKKVRRVLLALLIFSTARFLQLNLQYAPDLHEPILVGHRGSLEGVENTIEAIQGAIDAEADYAEVDILLSADGVPMVTHDDSMQRLANENVAIHDLTAAEISELTLQQDGHTGKISTLEEVLQYTQGKIELAIELKTHGHEKKNLVDEVAKLMEKYDVLESSIVLSLDYNLVDEMNTKHPETYSGFCIFGSLGYVNPDIVRKDMNIDFAFIEEWMATKETLMTFRRAWLPVYIWTVNEAESMANYLEIGALGLVTDYPDVGREKLDEFRENSPRAYFRGKWRRELDYG